MSSKRSRMQWAEKIIDHIPSGTQDEPISVAELARRSGLKEQEVREGVAELRDMFTGEGDDGDVPLISDHRGYIYTLDAGRVAAFRLKMCKTAYTIMRRMYVGAIRRYLRSVPASDRVASQHARIVDRQCKRAIEDLGELIGV